MKKGIIGNVGADKPMKPVTSLSTLSTIPQPQTSKSPSFGQWELTGVSGDSCRVSARIRNIAFYSPVRLHSRRLSQVHICSCLLLYNFLPGRFKHFAEVEVTEVNRIYNHSIEECDISTAVRRVYSRDVHRMSYLFGRNSSIAAQRDEVRACLRRDPTSVSISWMVQPKLVNGVYVFSKYYESSSFLHSIDDYLCLEISLILRETCENTMGFFIQSKNLTLLVNICRI